MGDNIIITDIKVIQEGLFQIDIHNKTNNRRDRLFIEPDELFNMIGNAMKENHDKYIKEIDI